MDLTPRKDEWLLCGPGVDAPAKQISASMANEVRRRAGLCYDATLIESDAEERLSEIGILSPEGLTDLGKEFARDLAEWDEAR